MDSEKCDQRVTVDYIVYESERAGWERTNKRLWIENIVDKVIIVIVIGLFLWLLSGTEFESYEVEADGQLTADRSKDTAKSHVHSNVREKITF